MEAAEQPVDGEVLCLVLAFDRMRPMEPSASFVPRAQHIDVGRGVATGLDVDAHRITVRDRSISTQHFALSCESERWVLVDRGSMNGTFVNAMRVKRQEVRDGDVIEAGASYFVVTRAPVNMAGTMRQLAPAASSGLDSFAPALALK